MRANGCKFLQTVAHTARAISSALPVVGRRYQKPESCVVTIHGDFVSKRATSFSGPGLEDLYLALLARPVECLARPKKAPKVRRASLTVEIQPVGFFRNPGEQMKYAARSVLTALDGLHKIEWVYRDVRATKVMEVSGDGWYLMDLEWAQRVGQPLEKYAPKRNNSPLGN